VWQKAACSLSSNEWRTRPPRARSLLRGRYRDRHEVSFKSEIDLVTATDRDAERAIVDCIRAAFPDHGIVAEESPPVAGRDAHRWYIDPLDGTTNFAHGYPQFAVSIALADGEDLVFGLVHDPMREETFTAERGQDARLNGAPMRVSAAAELIDSLLCTGFPYDVHGASIPRSISPFRRGDAIVWASARQCRLDLCRRVRPPGRVLGVEAPSLGRRGRTVDRRGGGRPCERFLRRTPSPERRRNRRVQCTAPCAADRDARPRPNPVGIGGRA
jgi:hypothetical protein